MARVLLWIIAAALGVVIGLGIQLLSADQAAPSSQASTNPGPLVVRNGEPPAGEATPLPADRISAEASSTLPDFSETLTYAASNMLDGDPLTAWNSNSPERDGRGETLTFRFSEPAEITAIRLINGYAKSDELFEANHRIQRATVVTDGDRFDVTLLDVDQLQEIPIGGGPTSKVVIEIEEIFRGVGFPNPALSADLAVSEIEFLALS